MSANLNELREVTPDQQQAVTGGKGTTLGSPVVLGTTNVGAAASPVTWENWSKLFAGSVTGGGGEGGGLLHEPTHAK